MKSHEFHRKYAGMPLQLRYAILNMNESGTMSMNDLYHRIKTLEDEMRPKQIELEKLLNIAEEYFTPTSTNS